jgi:Ca2+-transporting ATPase
MVVYLPQCSCPYFDRSTDAKSSIGLPSPISTQYSLMKHLIKDKILVQMPYSCELMAGVTDLCTDMTGTMTQDHMTVISGLVGTHLDFRRDHQATGYSQVLPQVSERSVDLHVLNMCLSPPLQRLFNETIVLTCTALQDVDPITGVTEFVGSATEVALLQFAQELGWSEFQPTRNAAQILEMIPFSSNRMASGAFVDLGDGRCRLYLKGASEVLAKKCTRRILVDEDVEDEIQTSPIDSTTEDIINQTIASYADQGLRTISLCYRDFDSWPPGGLPYNEHDDVGILKCLEDFILTLTPLG